MQEVKPITIDKAIGIYNIMRKAPEPVMPNTPEQPAKNIIDVMIQSDGTVRTYLENEKYPIRFYTLHQAVDVVANYKRLFRLLAKNGFWGILAIYFNRKVWSEWFKRMWELYPILLKESHYSQPVKEIRCALRGEMDDNILNAITMVIQNDMAYCYRMQDILSELCKENFNKDPIKEINRLLDIFISRDPDIRNKNLGRMIKKYSWLLRFKGLKQIKRIVNRLNVDELKLSVEDVYWTNIVPNYNYRGISYEERFKEYNLEKNSVENNANNSTNSI